MIFILVPEHICLTHGKQAEPEVHYLASTTVLLQYYLASITVLLQYYLASREEGRAARPNIAHNAEYSQWHSLNMVPAVFLS